MKGPPPCILIQKSEVLLYIEYKILATKGEVSWIFYGQNAYTKTHPEISELDLFHAHNIHFSNYSNNKDYLVLS
jgi:hypothetical protein